MRATPFKGGFKIIFGSVVLLEAMFAGPISGASMNPARSLAPALVSGHLETIWIYLLAPPLGAIAAIPVWKYLGNNKPE
jgi:aquaporin NIP